MPSSFAPITLMSDFGLSDHFVGQMKGAILGIAPTATIVDITHAIAPQDIRTAAFLLADLDGAFPAGTVHLAVVDPGVGSTRRILAISAGDQFYVGPDNGLFTVLLDRDPQATIVALPQEELGHPVRPTFHGRDIMAPAAARLSQGQRLADLGTPPEFPPLHNPEWIPKRETNGRIAATIVRIDNFGNLVTNVHESLIGGCSRAAITAFHGESSVRGLKRYYSEVPDGEVVLLIGSTGYVEIAVNGGSAAECWGACLGDSVTIDTASVT